MRVAFAGYGRKSCLAALLLTMLAGGMSTWPGPSALPASAISPLRTPRCPLGPLLPLSLAVALRPSGASLPSSMRVGSLSMCAPGS